MSRKRQSTRDKFEHNWRNKTLEILENSYWDVPEFQSHLTMTCHALRKKQLIEFDTEDLRIMIGQNIGLKYLIPLALEVLDKDIAAEGDYFPGDLLKNVLESDVEYWKNELDNWGILCGIFIRHQDKLMQLDSVKSVRKNWLEPFERFQDINK